MDRFNLPDADLAYLPHGTEHFKDYVEAVPLGAERTSTAEPSVDDMAGRCKPSPACGEVNTVSAATVEAVNCHHNYVTWEHPLR